MVVWGLCCQKQGLSYYNLYFMVNKNKTYLPRTILYRGREVAQQLRELAALAEEWGSVPSTDMVVHNCL